mgnify:CR=1 FL=1
MTGDQIQILIAMCLYMAMMVIVGAIYSKRNNSSSNYLLGGRKLGPWVTAMSAEASDMSGWLLMGLPGLAYLTGIGEVFWTALGLAVGTYLNWLFVAKRLRKYTKVAGNSITLPDYFSNRFRDKKKILMSLAAVLILLFFVIYLGSGFAAMGKLFKSLFGLDYTLMMIISAIVIIVYSVVGGFLAVCTTDLIQGVLMFFALLAIVFVGYTAVGGAENITAQLSGINGYFSIWGVNNPADNSFTQYSALDIISILAWGLGYFGMPHVLLRFMAIRKTRQIRHSRRIATVWVVISLGAAIMIGVIGRALLGDVLMDGTQETVFSALAGYLFPALIGGIFISGILASTMSTSDSQLLAAASVISKNFFHGLIKKDATDKQILTVSKATVIGAALIGILFALDENSTVFGIVSYAWAGFGATFGPLVILSLFWKRMNKWGALAGMIGGAATVIIWNELLNPLGGVFGIYELLPGFIVALVAIVTVSLLTKAPSQEIIDEFDSVKTAEADD